MDDIKVFCCTVYINILLGSLLQESSKKTSEVRHDNLISLLLVYKATRKDNFDLKPSFILLLTKIVNYDQTYYLRYSVLV